MGCASDPCPVHRVKTSAPTVGETRAAMETVAAWWDVAEAERDRNGREALWDAFYWLEHRVGMMEDARGSVDE